MKYANLHLHSIYSDAQFTPEQLVLIGKALGYKALALTDHETDGGTKEFVAYAKAEGIETVTGVEFCGIVDGINVHLTALDFDPEENGIREFIQKRIFAQMEFTRKCVERGVRLGYIQGLKWDDVLDFAPNGAWLCIDSVIRAMQLKKLVSADYDWERFRANVFKGPEIREYRPDKVSACEVIETVRKAGGVVALAHPAKQTHLVEKLVSYGLNGIEVCHPHIDETDTALAKEAADVFRLYRCGGTDHTGPMSGCGGENAIPAFHGVTEEEFFTIKERKLG